MNKPSFKTQKWSRLVHRYLSFFFAGMIMIYAVSGLVMNHRNVINPYYYVSEQQFEVSNPAQFTKQNVTVDAIKQVLEPLGAADEYTHHYFRKDNVLKVFLKGGSSVHINTSNGDAYYECLTKKVVLGSMTKLHYNPSSWWSVFSDVFAVALLLIVITGFTMMRSKQVFTVKVLIPFAAGILIPILFLFFL